VGKGRTSVKGSEVEEEIFYQLDLQSRAHSKWFREEREFATVADLIETMRDRIADNPERWRVIEVSRTEKVLSTKMLMQRIHEQKKGE
jgi:hypothetical protein